MNLFIGLGIFFGGGIGSSVIREVRGVVSRDAGSRCVAKGGTGMRAL